MYVNRIDWLPTHVSSLVHSSLSSQSPVINLRPTLVTNQSDAVSKSAYCSYWIGGTFGRSLQIVMMRSKVPSRITAAKFYSMSLESFSQVSRLLCQTIIKFNFRQYTPRLNYIIIISCMLKYLLILTNDLLCIKILQETISNVYMQIYFRFYTKILFKKYFKIFNIF